ncbi:MAG TPA: AI-2E family transporter [Pyrinomonadaceae bacterium]|jgi:predicted PurR-regulated permease PerM|nr:AI-2E family transporter [Pyrinomonadaceae bacterium]
MKPSAQQVALPEQRPLSTLWDTLVRVALIGGLALLCFRVFSPFLNLMVWSIILSITLYPLHQKLARGVGNRQWLASTVLVILGVALIVVPTWLLMNSFADSVRGFVSGVQQNTLHIPPPREGIRSLPLVGQKLYDGWSKAQNDLPALIQSLQPKAGDLLRHGLSIVASIGRGMLLFLASFVVANILMAYGESAANSGHAFFTRVAGPTRGGALAKLSLSTIRAVALGVIGVAAIQSLLIGLALLLAGIPIAGVLAIIALVLGIAQVPALIITIPVIIYIWSSGNYSSGAAIAHTIILLLTGIADNVLKPLMLGRGVDVPMPVILLGALGGMATGGIQGMFIGATALALGYELFRNWIATAPDSTPAR